MVGKNPERENLRLGQEQGVSEVMNGNGSALPVASFTLCEGGYWKDFPSEISDTFLMDQILNPKNRVDMGKRFGHFLKTNPFRVVINYHGCFYVCAAIRLRNGDIFDVFLNAYRKISHASL